MAEISQTIIGALQTAMAELTSAVSSVNSIVSNVLSYKADKTELTLKAPLSNPSFTGGITISGLPISAEGLSQGALWVDTTADNVIKIVI